MLTMLVVDDEIYALQAVARSIDWSDLPIGRVLEAETVQEAQRLLLAEPVDLIVSDIEMPGASGLELLKWIRDNRLDALTIFLTGHAKFEYAQEALHHGCFNYVLKPVDHDRLKGIVRLAVEEIDRRRRQSGFEEKLEKYRRQWAEQLPVLTERCWQELLADRIAPTPERLGRMFAQLDIPLTADDRVLPVLLSVEQWDVELDSRDESVMEYALRKAAAETILADLPGAVVQDRSQSNVALVYLPGGERPDRAELLRRCREYVEACGRYFHCRLSCYVGEATPIGELSAELERLMQLERANVASPQSVIEDAPSGERPGPAVRLPSFVEWGVLLDHGSYAELERQVEAAVRQFQEEAAGRETLELFRHGFLHMLYQSSHRRGVSVYETVDAAALEDGQAVRSPLQLGQWAARLLARYAHALQDRQKDASAIVARVQAYIQDNLHRELNRDDIAASVYRNPAYVSRLFRKETGLSLTDYIAHVRIERAKTQLAETNDKISHIAESLGYVHFSYFAKWFKKLTGVSPQEYRKKHQILNG